MSYTRTQLANRALEKLFLVGSGQSPDAEDTEKVDDVIDAFSAYISSTEPPIYTIADLDAIEDNAFEPLSDYLAWFVAPDFKKMRDETKRQMAEFMLQRITASGPTYQPMTAEHF